MVVRFASYSCLVVAGGSVAEAVVGVPAALAPALAKLESTCGVAGNLALVSW
jgi:hypothetical protein